MGFKTTEGFSLIELLVSLLIVAILATLAYPGYIRQQLRSNRSEAYSALNNILQAEERFAADHGRYTFDLSKLGYGNPHRTASGNYSISALDCKEQPGNHCVRLTASAQGAQKQDDNGEGGNLSLNSRGMKTGW